MRLRFSVRGPKGQAAGGLLLARRGGRPYVTGMTDVTYLEEQIAYLGRTVDDLSEVVARQEREIALLTRRLALVLEREAEREAADSGTIPLADQKPPHW